MTFLAPARWEFLLLPGGVRPPFMAEMTDQFTSLSPAAMRDIIAKIDESLAIFERHTGKLHTSEFHAKTMLIALRARMIERLQSHPNGEE